MAPTSVAQGVRRASRVEARHDAEHRRLDEALAERGLAAHRPAGPSARRPRRRRTAAIDRAPTRPSRRGAGRAGPRAPRRPARRPPRRPIRATPATTQAKSRSSQSGAAPSSTRVDDRRRVPELGERRSRSPATSTSDAEQRQPQHHAEPVGGQAAHVAARRRRRAPAPAIAMSSSPSSSSPQNDGQVVGDRDRADRHHDQVVEQDRPAGDEAPELVERVAGERRRRRRARGAASCPRRR